MTRIKAHRLLWMTVYFILIYSVGMPQPYAVQSKVSLRENAQNKDGTRYNELTWSHRSTLPVRR